MKIVGNSLEDLYLVNMFGLRFIILKLIRKLYRYKSKNVIFITKFLIS
ncbi:MAG: hypothetical protein BAJALOKI2v1_1080003 [Promethearchaeota archaeon]|nr:MAG: hypothetical protein BAJALOKI2v1_1080003 [Candidatus Lokiarchaeota archaeon]